MGGGGEAGAVADGGQQHGGGPDADSWHRGQDLGKRVCLQQGVDLGFQGPALFVDSAEGAGQGGNDGVEGAGPGHDHGLLVQCVEDFVDQPGGHARGPGADELDESAAAGFPQGGWGSVVFQQPGDGPVVQTRSQDALQAGVELGEQAAYPVGRAGGLGGEVLAEADQDGQLGCDFVGQFQRAQGVGQGAGCVRDHRCVLGVGLRLARVEIGDPAHRQAGQVGDLAARVPGHGQGEGADGGGLVHDHQPLLERWRAAERAHILSQPWPFPHTRTHAVMLHLAVRERDLLEIIGQLVCLAVAAPGSAAGRCPTGNTGRTRVGLNTSMPIPGDLATLLQAAGVALEP